MIGRATSKHYLLFTGGERFRRRPRTAAVHRECRRRSPASCSPAARAGAWAASTRDWSSSRASRWSRTCSSASRRRSTRCSINANQNLDRYARFGHPVIADAIGGFAGPLAGLACAADARDAALRRHRALRLAVPAGRPGRAAARGARRATHAQLAVAQTGDQPHPVFCLVRRDVLPHLAAFLAAAGARSTRGTRRSRWSKSPSTTRPTRSATSTRRRARRRGEATLTARRDRHVGSRLHRIATASRTAMTSPRPCAKLSCADDYDPNSMPVDRARALIRPFLVAGHGDRARATSARRSAACSPRT